MLAARVVMLRRHLLAGLRRQRLTMPHACCAGSVGGAARFARVAKVQLSTLHVRKYAQRSLRATIPCLFAKHCVLVVDLGGIIQSWLIRHLKLLLRMPISCLDVEPVGE